MKKQLFTILALAMAFTMTACSSGGGTSGSTSVTPGRSVTIGIFEPKTGQNRSSGIQEELGIAYANSLRPTITVDGKTYQVTLDWQDNQSSKEGAVTAAQNLIADDCTAVIGGYASDCCIVASHYFANAQIPAVGTSCTSPKVTTGNDYYFRTCYLNSFQGTFLADWAMEQGYKEIATVNNLNSDYTSGLVSAFTTEFEAQGGTVTDAETFRDNETDFTTLLTNLKKSGVKAVFAPTDYVYAPLLLNQAANQSFNVQWITSNTWNSSQLTKDVGANAKNVVMDCFYAEGTDPDFDKGFQTWIKADDSRLNANLGTSAIVGNQVMAFNSYNVLLDAMEQADSLEGADIRNALASSNKKNAIGGPLAFDENGDTVKSISYILQIQNGTVRYLNPITHED